MTCEKDFEKRALREALEVLSRYVDEEPVVEEHTEEPEQPVDISKAVKAEVAELKKKTSSLFHIKYMSGVHGSGFLVFAPDAPDPDELVLHLMKDVYESGENMFKTCVKILPFTHSCAATHEEMEKLANELLPKHFPEEEGAPEHEFAVHAEKHCAANHELHTMEIIKIFADRVNARHHVNLTHPGKVILVSIIKNLCCFSVVDGVLYEKYGKYNVRQCLEKHLEEEEGNKRKAEDEGREGGVKKVNSESELRVGVEAV